MNQVTAPELVKLIGLLEHERELITVSELTLSVPLLELSALAIHNRNPLPKAVAIRLALSATHCVTEARQLLLRLGLDTTIRSFLSAGFAVTDYGAVLLSEAGVMPALVSTTTAQRDALLRPQFAPEELTGDGAVIERAEVYSLGVLLWELLTNRRLPSAADSRVGAQDVPTLSNHERFSQERYRSLVRLVERATRRKPSERYSSLSEFESALRALPACLVAPEAMAADFVRRSAGVFLRRATLRPEGNRTGVIVPTAPLVARANVDTWELPSDTDPTAQTQVTREVRTVGLERKRTVGVTTSERGVLGEEKDLDTVRLWPIAKKVHPTLGQEKSNDKPTPLGSPESEKPATPDDLRNAETLVPPPPESSSVATFMGTSQGLRLHKIASLLGLATMATVTVTSITAILLTLSGGQDEQTPLLVLPALPAVENGKRPMFAVAVQTENFDTRLKPSTEPEVLPVVELPPIHIGPPDKIEAGKKPPKVQTSWRRATRSAESSRRPTRAGHSCGPRCSTS
jgi:hypothetical protein